MHTLTIPKLFVYNLTQVLSLRHRMLCVLLHFKLNVKFVLIPLRSANFLVTCMPEMLILEW